MNRYRLVTKTTRETVSETHISSVLQTLSEALADQGTEEYIARLAGWHTASRGNGPWPELVCTRHGVVRTINIRETTPFDDEIA